jgi:hypothetical protein
MTDKVTQNNKPQALLKQVGKAVFPAVGGAINGAKLVSAAVKTVGLQNKLGELLGEREQIREKFIVDNTQETRSSSTQSKEMNQALSNEDQAKQGSAFLNSINASNADKSLTAQIDSTKKNIADVKSEAGQTTLSSELGAPVNNSSPSAQPNNTAAPAKEAPAEKPTSPSMPESMIPVGIGKTDINPKELISGLEQNGGKMLENQDPTHIAQFKGEANTNENAAANGNCGAATLAGLARATGVRSGDAASANADIEEASNKMGRNSEYEGSTIDSFVKGAQDMKMDAKAHSGIGLDDIKKELKNGNHVALATDPSKYTGYTKKGGHLTRVTGYDEKTNSFTLNDSLFQKPIQVSADKLGDAMKSGLLGDSKNTMVVIQGNKSEAGLGGSVVAESKKSEGTPSSSSTATTKSTDSTQQNPSDKPKVVEGTSGRDGGKQTAQASSSKVDVDEPNAAKKEEKMPNSLSEFYDPKSPFHGKENEYDMNETGQLVKKEKANLPESKNPTTL